MAGYHAVLPDLTEEEAAVILDYMKEVREMAVDYKSMKQISVIFEIYKTRSEQYLNSKGRNWRQLYRDYGQARKADKQKQKKN